MYSIQCVYNFKGKNGRNAIVSLPGWYADIGIAILLNYFHICCHTSNVPFLRCVWINFRYVACIPFDENLIFTCIHDMWPPRHIPCDRFLFGNFHIGMCNCAWFATFKHIFILFHQIFVLRYDSLNHIRIICISEKFHWFHFFRIGSNKNRFEFQINDESLKLRHREMTQRHTVKMTQEWVSLKFVSMERLKLLKKKKIQIRNDWHSQWNSNFDLKCIECVYVKHQTQNIEH